MWSALTNLLMKSQHQKKIRTTLSIAEKRHYTMTKVLNSASLTTTPPFTSKCNSNTRVLGQKDWAWHQISSISVSLGTFFRLVDLAAILDQDSFTNSKTPHRHRAITTHSRHSPLRGPPACWQSAALSGHWWSRPSSAHPWCSRSALSAPVDKTQQLRKQSTASS